MAVATTARERDVVYPEDRLPWPQTILMGLQHVMAMFGATVLVPLILGFNPNTVIFFSGVATLIFLFVTGRKVPSYLGSSFSFLGAVLAIQGGSTGHHDLAYGGILIAGAIYFLIGVAVHFVGINAIRFLLPPVVTGTVVSVIGLALAGAAWNNYKGDLLTATVTVLTAVLVSVYLRGFPRLLPVLFAVVVGYVVSLVDPVCQAATSACHIGLFGGTGETTYAENIGVMGVTRVFSIMIFVVAAVAAILLGFIPKFGALVNSIPSSVIGGIELYLFGLIAVIGAKIWVDGRVDFGKRANLAVAAIPLIL